MTKLEVFFLIVSLLVILLSLFVVFSYRRKTKNILKHMDEMLTAAMDGSFSETIFDESLLSAVETKLAHYLSASEVSARNLHREQEKIKELIADISHQTKTPISNLLLYTQLLREQELPEESLICVKALNSQAEKLNFLIGALVKTSRLEAGVFQLQPKPVLVQRILHTVLEQIAPKAEEKGIVITCAEADAVVCADRKWTGEALYNILDNAVKYTPGGGCIRVETTVYQMFSCVNIADNGMGISEEEQAQIFGRFYRSPKVSETEGVGIGLYLSRQIISSQGGYIKVRSAEGSGACFSVFLPIQA